LKITAAILQLSRAGRTWFRPRQVNFYGSDCRSWR